MKKFACMMAGFIFILSMGFLSGCGSSDGGRELDSRLFGTWTGVWEDEGCDFTQTINFKADGTFTYDESNSCYGGDTYDSEQGVWYTGNGRLYVTVTRAQGSESGDVDLNEEFSMPYIISSDGSALAIIDGDDLDEDGLIMVESEGGIVGVWESQDGDFTLTINADNTWSVTEDEDVYSGTYLLQGNMITLSFEGEIYTLFGIYTIIDSKLYIIFEIDGLLLKD